MVSLLKDRNFKKFTKKYIKYWLTGLASLVVEMFFLWDFIVINNYGWFWGGFFATVIATTVAFFLDDYFVFNGK